MRTALLFALMAPFCAAQTIEVESLFQPAPLSGPWKHHPGDDPRWADPAFDDSAWESLGMPEAAEQPHRSASAFRSRTPLLRHRVDRSPTARRTLSAGVSSVTRDDD